MASAGWRCNLFFLYNLFGGCVLFLEILEKYGT
jgi:hypothetical protein